MQKLIVFFLFLYIQAFAQDYSQLTGRIDAIFKDYDTTRPGCALAIIKEGKVILNKGYGLANLEYGLRIDTNSVFDIASLTKHFTAFSILLLEERGELSLEDEISKYFTDFPFKNKHIKIRHLLHHTSGIKDYIHLHKVAGYSVYGDYDNESILAQIKKQKTLNFEPGSSILYSNSNYILLAEIVNIASGKSLESFCSQFIFEPLQMNNTSFLNNKVLKRRVSAYNKNADNSYKNCFISNDISGPIGIQSSASDVARWINNLSTAKVGGRKTIAKFLAPTTLDDGTFINTNSCVVGKKSFRGLNLYLSNGNWEGYRSQIFYFPDQKIGIVILSNSGNDLNVYGASSRIAEILLEKEISVALKNSYPIKKMTSKKLKRFEGEYDLGVGFKVIVKLINDKLKIKSVWDADYLEMIPVDSNAFMVDNDDYRDRLIAFTYNSKEKNYELIYNHINVGRRYEYINPTQDYLKQFEGAYYSKEIETMFTITLKDSILHVIHFMNPELKLKPMKNEVFEAGEWWFDKIEFIRNSSNTIIGFNLSLDRINNLEFIKIAESKQ